MGYAGATYIVQEYCNALFDALFHILPLGTELDRIDPTPARPEELWDDAAVALLDAHVEAEPFLLRISAAKRLREQVEHAARAAEEQRITIERVRRTLGDVVARQVAEGVA
jgi:chlorophyllide a reductase subunit Z